MKNAIVSIINTWNLNLILYILIVVLTSKLPLVQLTNALHIRNDYQVFSLLTMHMYVYTVQFFRP